LAIHFIEVQRPARRIEVRHQLVTEEIEVDPLGGAATFRTTEQAPVKGARGAQIVDGNREMKRGGHALSCQIFTARNARGLSMKRAFPKIRTLLASALLVGGSAWGATAEQRTLEQKFDAQLQATDLQAWMKQMSSKPTHVGAPHDKANA